MLHNTLLRGVGGALKSSSLTSTGISGNFASSHSLRLLVQHTQVRGFYRVSDSEREKFRVKYKQEPNYAVDPAAKWHEKWQENLSTANSGMEETVRQDQGRWNKYPFYLLGGMAVYYAIYYFSFDDEIAQWAKDTKRFLTSYVFEPLLKNKENANEWIDRMVGPGERLLLPPPMPDGYGHKYTLVVDLDALIDTFPAKNGQVLITKRPGVDYFVSNASKYYEIVLYSKEMGGTNQMIIYKIDPSNSFSHHLFKESGLKDHDKFIHDFTRLNRDPSKVIFIDSNSLNNLYEHKNVISVGKGHPKNPDTILIDLVPILAKIAADNTPDVRTKLPELQTPDIANKLRQILGKAPVSQSSSSTQQSTGGVFGFLKK